MQYRRLGKTNLGVSVIGLGGLQFYNMSSTQVAQLILRSCELGINIIELGRSYAGSEEKSGYIIPQYRNKFYLSSKTAERKKELALNDIDISLSTLKTDYIDIYQIHHIDSYQQLDAVMNSNGALEALKLAKQQGKIRYIGITGHSPAVLTKAIKTGEFDVIEILFNIVEREALNELMPLAHEMDVGILGMKPFGGGAFLDTGNKIAQYFGQYPESVAQNLLRFVLSYNISCALAGSRTIKELECNALAGINFEPFSQLQLKMMLEEVDKIGMRDSAFCHRCGYCVCCPNMIDIPLILRFDEYLHKYKSKAWPVAMYRHVEQNAMKCTECGLCESKCPFNLPIRKMLKEAHTRLSQLDQ